MKMNQNPITRNESVLLPGIMGSLIGIACGGLLNYLCTGTDFTYFPLMVIVGFGAGAAFGMHFAIKNKARSLTLRISVTLLALLAAAAYMHYVLREEDFIFSIILIAGAAIMAWMTSKEGAIRPNLFGGEDKEEEELT